jgi:hypothetical protein
MTGEEGEMLAYGALPFGKLSITLLANNDYQPPLTPPHLRRGTSFLVF